MIIGRIGSKEEKTFQDGSTIINASVAVSEKYTKRDGTKAEDTTWFSVVFSGKLAEIVGQYVAVGDMVYIEGRMKCRQWQDKEGTKRYNWELIAGGMQMLSSKNGTQDAAPAPASRPQPSGPIPAPQPEGEEGNGDLPF